MKRAAGRACAQDIADSLKAMGPVTVSRFFGGAALRVGGVQFAFVMWNSLYLCVDADSRPAFEALDAAPFKYAGRSGIVTVARYYEAPAEIVEDPDALLQWAQRARRAAATRRKAPVRATSRAAAAASEPRQRRSRRRQDMAKPGKLT